MRRGSWGLTRVVHPKTKPEKPISIKRFHDNAGGIWAAFAQCSISLFVNWKISNINVGCHKRSKLMLFLHNCVSPTKPRSAKCLLIEERKASGNKSGTMRDCVINGISLNRDEEILISNNFALLNLSYFISSCTRSTASSNNDIVGTNKSLSLLTNGKIFFSQSILNWNEIVNW